MSFKHSKRLSLSKKKSTSDYLKIIKKKSVDFSGIIDKNICKFSDEKFSSLKQDQNLHKLQNLPVTCQRNFVPKDNYEWSQITVLFGPKYGKQFIVSNLLKCIHPFVFTPIMYGEVENKSVFYVDEQIIATKLAQCNRKIKTEDGYKLSIFVNKKFPECDIDNFAKKYKIMDRTLITKLKYVASKRLCEKTRTLDLTRFHCDPELANDYFCPLFITNIFSIIVDFVSEYMPDLEVLKLQKNNLRLSSSLGNDILKFSHLKALYLNDNLIKNINGLTLLKNLKLEELHFSGNPLRGLAVKHKDDYVAYIRTLFPKLLILDGIKLEAPIVMKFEDNNNNNKEEEEKELPSAIKNFSYNFKVHEIAQQFIRKYFTMYDSNLRESLLSSYHNLGFFSMTLTSIIPRSYESRNLDDYKLFHRNLITMKTMDQRRSLLKQGRLSIVTLLSLLPETYHFLNSFSTDVTMQTNKIMMINISGCFKEVNTKLQSIFYFNRTFIILLEGREYTILNDQLYLSHPTLRQKIQFAKGLFDVVPTVLPVPEIKPPMSSTLPPPVKANSTSVYKSKSNSQILGISMEKCIADVNFSPNLQGFLEPIKEYVSDPNVKAHCELIDKNISNNNSTSESQVPIVSIVKSEPLSPSAQSTSEPDIAVDRLKRKLIYLRGILSNCLSAIEEFLDDEEFKERFS